MNRGMLEGLCAATTLPLLPVLLIQGLAVRRQTPRLPEAGGASSGFIAGSGQPIKLITLGESTVAGVGATTHEEALTGQIATALNRRTQQAIQWLAVGQNGVTAEQTRLRLVPLLADKKADVIVIALGVNDVLRLHSPSRWQRDLEDLLQAIQHQLGTIPNVVAGMPPLGRFPAFPQPLRAVFGLRAKALAHMTAQLAHRWPQVTYCPLPIAQDASGFASDGFHPGPLGYSIWGDNLAECIQCISLDTWR